MHYVLIPFAWLLRMLYHLFNNYGVALILFSLITKLILMPFTAKSKKSMMKTSRLGPKLKELEAKCGDDKMKYQQEMQALYKKEGVTQVFLLHIPENMARLLREDFNMLNFHSVSFNIYCIY